MDNKQIFDILGISRFHQAGYTGKNVKAMTYERGETNILTEKNTTILWADEYPTNDPREENNTHSKQTSTVFLQVCPDAHIYQVFEHFMKTGDGVYSGFLIDTLLPWIMENKPCVAWRSLYDPSYGYDSVYKPTLPFLSLFNAAGNYDTEKYTGRIDDYSWFGVGAVKFTGNSFLAESYSSVDDDVDFVAPLIYIPTTTYSEWYMLNGTSIACPVMAGMAGLVNDFMIQNIGRALSHDEMYEFIKSHCHDIGPIYGEDNKTGFGVFILPAPETIDTSIYKGGDTMIYSNDVNDLRADVRDNFILLMSMCEELGLDIKIVNTLRDNEKQLELFNAGYSQSKVTTFHGAGLAIDFCSISEGYNNLEFFRQVAEMAKAIGFSWGGDWKSFPDMPHLFWNNHGASTDSMILAGNYPPKMIYGGNTMFNEEKIRAIYAEEYEKINPMYKTFDDVPDYWKPEIRRLLDAGNINGGTPANINPNDVNMRRDTVQAIIAAKRF